MAEQPPVADGAPDADRTDADPASRSERRGDDPDPLALLRETPTPTPSLDLGAVLALVRDRSGAVALLAVVLVVGGVLLFSVFGRGSSPPELSLPTLTTDSVGATPTSMPSSTTSPAGPLVVHAAGAVVTPGVYELPPGSRIADLVAAAGGLTTDADADRVNLAGPVIDGQRVYVPRRDEAAVPEVVAGDDGATVGGSVGEEPGGTGGEGEEGRSELVDVNTATLDELDTLPGVGPTTAQAIIDHREANGPFRSVDDLLDVRGIGEAKLEQLRPLVSV